MIALTEQTIAEAAKTKPAGYREDLLANGILRDGVLYLQDSQYASLLKKYRPAIRGAGDLLRRITDMLHLPHCIQCDKRQEWLNRKLPFR